MIAAGGGGPPVYADPLLGLEGLDAVVDKDRVAAILAAQLEAEVLHDPHQRGGGVRRMGNARRAADPADDGGRRPTP